MAQNSRDKVMEEELVQIKVPALIDLISHVLRFNDIKAKSGDNQCVYGFLKGSVEGKNRIIKEVETIMHHPTPDYEFDEQFIKDMDKV